MNFIYSIIAFTLLGATPSAIALDKDIGTLKVGVILPLSGGQKAYGDEAKAGIELALEDFIKDNKEYKGIIKVIYADDKGLPSEAQKQTLDLVKKKRVNFLMGSVSTPNSKEIALIAQKEQIPMISPITSNQAVTDVGDHIFSTREDPSQDGIIFAKFAKDYKNVVIISDERKPEYAKASKLFKEHFEKNSANKATIINRFDYKKAYPMKVDAIFYNVLGTTSNWSVLEEIHSKNKAPLFLNSSWKATRYGTKVKDMKNIYFTTPYHIENSSNVAQTFVKGFNDTMKRPPSALAGLTYDGFKFICETFKSAKSIRAKPLLRHISKVEEATGTMGPIKMTDSRFALKTFVITNFDSGKEKISAVITPFEKKDKKS